MNVGQAITAAMVKQRKKDIETLLYSNYGNGTYHRLLAYWWWGWDINGHGGLGKPGADL